MQIQEILTFSIIALAIGYTLYSLLKTVFLKHEKTNGCASGCTCDAVKLREELLSKKNS